MKRFSDITQGLLLTTILLVLGNSARAQMIDPALLDSVEISLLTCSPHDEVYSLYGHTALRVKDAHNNRDYAVNYGVFDYTRPNFVMRFVFGLTDYEMGIVPFRLFLYEYQYYGSSITAQVINLTRQEKQRILEALEVNARPENVVYRYNFFYNNCTTKARDMITEHLDGKVSYRENRTDAPSFRQMTHACTTDYPWGTFGNDFLLGVQADQHTTISEQQFLPAYTMQDFATATITSADGKVRPLVARTEEILPQGVQVVKEGVPFRPVHVAMLILTISIILTIIGQRTGRTMWGWDALLLTLCSLAGIPLAMMLFSEHPTVRLNLQILLFNPLPLLFIWRMIKRSVRRQPDWQFSMWAVLTCLFFIGSILQHYAEGTLILGSAVLLRMTARIMQGRRLSATRA